MRSWIIEILKELVEEEGLPWEEPMFDEDDEIYIQGERGRSITINLEEPEKNMYMINRTDIGKGIPDDDYLLEIYRWVHDL
jgi:hypothetical protein